MGYWISTRGKGPATHRDKEQHGLKHVAMRAGAPTVPVYRCNTGAPVVTFIKGHKRASVEKLAAKIFKKHGLTEEEMSWRTIGGRLTLVYHGAREKLLLLIEEFKNRVKTWTRCEILHPSF